MSSVICWGDKQWEQDKGWDTTRVVYDSDLADLEPMGASLQHPVRQMSLTQFRMSTIRDNCGKLGGNEAVATNPFALLSAIWT
jgi:hypothetical protein